MKQLIPETLPDYDVTRMVERPDGFYWQRKDGAREHGPFPTLLEAAQDMQIEAAQDMELVDGEALEPGESVEEAEAEIGMSGWIDPDTGEPAEGEGTRIEEH
jgi:hypothetical protein